MLILHVSLAFRYSCETTQPTNAPYRANPICVPVLYLHVDSVYEKEIGIIQSGNQYLYFKSVLNNDAINLVIEEHQ